MHDLSGLRFHIGSGSIAADNDAREVSQLGSTTMRPQSISDFIHSLPKTEIHIHAEATISFDSYFALHQRNGSDLDVKSPEDFRKLLTMDSLAVMIRNFFYLQSLLKTSEDFELVVPDIERYARRNNIHYLELFVSPSMVLKQGGIDFSGIMDPLVAGFDRVNAAGGADIRMIIDVSRTFGVDNAKNNLKLLLEYLKNRNTQRIIGIGLGGQESGNPCKDYKAVFAAARDAGLHTVAHAGEEVGPESVWEAVADLKAERIGHGISAIEDPKLMDYLKEKRIPLEICPTSNIITGKFVQKYENHPAKKFFDHGILVTLNTDDPVLFDVELDRELCESCEKLKFSKNEIVQVLKNGIESTFMDAEHKRASLEKLEKSLA